MLRFWFFVSFCALFANGWTATITSTTTTTVCSCTRHVTTAGRTLTSTISGTSSCSSQKLRPTCSVSTIRKTITTVIKTTTTSSTRRPSTTSSTRVQTTPSITRSTTKVTTASTTKPSVTTTTSRCSPTPTKSSGKRGVAYNSTPLTNLFSLSCVKSKTSWSYNWYSSVATDNLASTYNKVLTFIPMLWSAAPVLTGVWTANANAAISAGADALLSFNEPDACQDGSACMNVSTSVSAYRTWMQPFAGRALLGSPAVTNGVAPMGLAYLQSFLGNCTGCTIDFVPIHWYGDASQVADFEAYVQQAHAVAGRPLWITEFGCTSGTDAQVQTFMQAVIPWLDAQSYVSRYSYFMARPGLLVNANGTALSEDGVIFDQL